jgi:hypothetical protein
VWLYANFNGQAEAGNMQATSNIKILMVVAHRAAAFALRFNFATPHSMTIH